MRAREKDWAWLSPVLVVLAVLATFAPSLANGFVSWDDPIHVVNNVHIRAFTWANLKWMMGPSAVGLLMPLDWLSLAGDFHFWGLEPAGYHLGNVLWQAAGALLWFGFWRRLFRFCVPKASAWDAALSAAFAALFFAIHPMRVESVAWVTERRDVLCGFFFAAASWSYLEYALGGRAKRWLAAAFVFHALSLLAKPLSVCLPVALLILDAYPLKRLDKKAVVEKIPFFLLSAAVLAINWVWLSREGDIHGLVQHGLWERVVRASYALLFYPRKMLWPAPLMAIYELPHAFDPFAPRFLAWTAAAALAIVASWRLSRRWPAFGAAAVYYVAAFLPISGLAIHGVPHLAFDRYFYLPSLGFAGLAGALFLKGLESRGFRSATLILGAALLAVFGALSWKRCLDWRDGETLWRSALLAAPDCEQAHLNLAAELAQRGRWGEAGREAEEAARLEPGAVLPLDNLGAVELNLNRLPQAEAAFSKAAELNPKDASARRGLSRVAIFQGNDRVALEEASAAAELEPGDAVLRFELGQILLRLGGQDEARRAFEEALRLAPNLAPAHTDLGLILQARGKLDEAAAQYQAALRGGPSAEALFDWGNLEVKRGRLPKAVHLYTEAKRVQPDFAAAAENRRRVLAALKRD